MGAAVSIIRWVAGPQQLCLTAAQHNIQTCQRPVCSPPPARTHHTAQPSNVHHLHQLHLGRGQRRGGRPRPQRAPGPGGGGLDRGRGETNGFPREERVQGTEIVSAPGSELEAPPPLRHVRGRVLGQVLLRLEQGGLHVERQAAPEPQAELQHQDGRQQKPQAVLSFYSSLPFKLELLEMN